MGEEYEARAIGFRAEPSKFHWAAVGGTKNAPLRVETDYHAPAISDDEAQALAEHRREVIELVQRFKPTWAWVRSPEFNIFVKRDLLIRRSRLEGVIAATLEAHGVIVKIGTLGSIKAKSKTKAAPKRRKKGEPAPPKVTEPTAKQILSATSFRGIDWKDDAMQIREAIFAAASVLDLKKEEDADRL